MSKTRPVLPFSAVERMIAFRYLKPRRKEGFVSVIAGFSFLGILLGVATLIIVMSVMNGFRAELMSRVLGFNGHIVVVGVGGPLTNHRALDRKIHAVDGVTRTTSYIDGQVMATANGAHSGVVVRGVSPEELAENKEIAEGIASRTLARFEEEGGVILGWRLAAALRLDVGDRVKLISPVGTPTPLGPVPNIRSFEVAGTFNVGMSEYDQGFIYMPFNTASEFFRTQGGATRIEVMVENPDNVRDVVFGIVEQRIANIRVRDWQENHATFFNALKVERNVMFLILTLIIIVAAFNIISSLIMMVKDKVGAIAILRTMGATRGAIMRVFFLSGASIGVVGTLIGVLIGVLFSDNIDTIKQWLEGLTDSALFPAEIYFLSRLPSQIDPWEVVQVALLGLGLSFLATIYPSWRAARLDPVEALRNE